MYQIENIRYICLKSSRILKSSKKAEVLDKGYILVHLSILSLSGNDHS